MHVQLPVPHVKLLIQPGSEFLLASSHHFLGNGVLLDLGLEDNRWQDGYLRRLGSLS